MNLTALEEAAKLMRFAEENPRVLLDREQATIVATGRANKRLFEKLAYEGRGPKFMRIGGRALYRASDLFEWMAAQEVAA